MSRRQNAKYKLDRRVGENVWGRPKSPINNRQTRPGQHGARRANKPSDFGIQLMAKQKLKGFYGDITEKQFRKTYEEATRRTGNTAELLVGLLESRLDTVVYRSKFVPTIFAARQFVNHGHVEVNGRRVNIPSFRVRQGDVVRLRNKSRELIIVQFNMDTLGRTPPPWLDSADGGQEVTVRELPLREHIDVPVREQLIVELYSK